jgi:hypothetical protein
MRSPEPSRVVGCLRPLALAALTALVAACASAPDIRHDRDPSADLGRYRTFAFFDPLAAERASYTTIVGARLKQATREQLQQHYVYSESEPDLRVNVALDVVDKQELRTTPTAFGRHGYRAWAGGIESRDYRQGTLRIDLVDTKRNALVWRGVAERRIEADTLDSPGRTVEEVVGRIFAGFRTTTAQ